VEDEPDAWTYTTAVPVDRCPQL